MDFKPSPERQILFDTLKKYFENEYSLSDRNIAAHSDLGYSKKAWDAMRDLGILESLIDRIRWVWGHSTRYFNRF